MMQTVYVAVDTDIYIVALTQLTVTNCTITFLHLTTIFMLHITVMYQLPLLTTRAPTQLRPNNQTVAQTNNTINLVPKVDTNNAQLYHAQRSITQQPTNITKHSY